MLVVHTLIALRNEMRKLPPSRPLSIAITKVEEAALWFAASAGDPTVIGIFDVQPEEGTDEEPEAPSGGPDD